MEQLSVQAVLGLIGFIILIGLAGELFLKKTGIPSVLLLIALGVLGGPVLGLVEPSRVQVLAPYFGTLALLIILFDGGLNLHIAKLLREAPMALAFTVVVFAATVGVTAWVYAYLLGHPWRQGVLLGTILGGTTGAIVIPVVSRLTTLRDETKVILSLESAFTDVFVVIVTLAVIGMFTAPAGEAHFVRDLFHAFFDALLLAVVTGVLWARLLTWLRGQTYSYMLTLAAILVLYDVAELVGANGAITILLFGIVLANLENLVQRLAGPLRRAIGYELNRAEFSMDEILRRLNEELSFLVRTFFYVLLGLILDLSTMTWNEALVGLLLFVAAVVTRWLVVEGFGRYLCGWTTTERRLVTAMLPRGLAAAVMAFLPVDAGIAGTDRFPLYVLIVIAFSVLYMTVAMVIGQNRSPVAAVPVPTSPSP